MDKIILERALQNNNHCQFWIKPIGIPDEAADQRETFIDDPIRVDFAKQPNTIEIGDILLVYRIGISKFVAVAECLSAPSKATSAEIEDKPWRERWCWSITARNLAPNYGAKWAKYHLKPFTICKEFNKFYPSQTQSLGSLNFGNDKLRVSRLFGEFVIRKIIALE